MSDTKGTAVALTDEDAEGVYAWLSEAVSDLDRGEFERAAQCVERARALVAA